MCWAFNVWVRIASILQKSGYSYGLYSLGFFTFFSLQNLSMRNEIHRSIVKSGAESHWNFLNIFSLWRVFSKCLFVNVIYYSSIVNLPQSCCCLCYLLNLIHSWCIARCACLSRMYTCLTIVQFYFTSTVLENCRWWRWKSSKCPQIYYKN